MELDTLCDGEPDCNQLTVCGGDPNCNANVGTSPDEVNLLCESKFPCISWMPCIFCSHADKCLLPHYGACPYTRLCETSVFGVRCGLCLPGYARNVTSLSGDCIGKFFCIISVYLQIQHFYPMTAADFEFTFSTFSEFENTGPLMGSVRLNTAGLIEEQILVVVQTVASGTATGNAVSKHLFNVLMSNDT